jgi:cytochrome P450
MWASPGADLMDVERRSTVLVRGSYRANIGMEESNMIALDDPEHLEQRRLVSRRFTLGPCSKTRRSCSQRRCRSTVRMRAEVVHDIAASLPSRLTADLLGFRGR